jgi:hypothetical protein
MGEPGVSRQTLRRYHTYLTAHLVFPFQAAIEDMDGVTTIRSLFMLNECPDLTFYGLFVRGNHGRRLIETPLATIEEVKDEGKNKQLIADYWWKCIPGGDYMYPVQATVLTLTAKRVKIEAFDDGERVIRYVPPESLQRQG